jgi:hypothetical protein
MWQGPAGSVRSGAADAPLALIGVLISKRKGRRPDDSIVALLPMTHLSCGCIYFRVGKVLIGSGGDALRRSMACI